MQASFSSVRQELESAPKPLDAAGSKDGRGRDCHRFGVKCSSTAASLEAQAPKADVLHAEPIRENEGRGFQGLASRFACDKNPRNRAQISRIYGTNGWR
jgi:hypothetical protein